jgi:hypothetical protein
MDHRPYVVSLLVQSFVPSVQILVYPSALPNVACCEPFIPPISVPFIENVVGFPNSMYVHVGPYTPYFCSSYGGIVTILTMWPPMFDPLIPPTTLLKLVSAIIHNRSQGAFK